MTSSAGESGCALSRPGQLRDLIGGRDGVCSRPGEYIARSDWLTVQWSVLQTAQWRPPAATSRTRGSGTKPCGWLPLLCMDVVVKG